MPSGQAERGIQDNTELDHCRRSKLYSMRSGQRNGSERTETLGGPCHLAVDLQATMRHVKAVGYRRFTSRQPGNIASEFVGDGSDLSSFTAEHMHKDGGMHGTHGTHGRGRAWG